MADTRPERRFTRIDRLPPYVFNITAELKMAARRRGEDIIDFSMGNPDGATPPHIVEKLCTVAQRPDTHGYSTSRGIPRLRRAISRWYQDRYDVEIDPESEAIVTIGSKEGLAHLMLATLDHGDTVLVPNPSYPIHIYGAVIAGAQVRSVPLVEGVDFFNELELYWLKGCMKRAGWSKCRRLRCMSGRKSRNHMRPWDRWNLPRSSLTKRRFVSRRGLALATMVIRMFALH
ncbi:aminotransferase [Shigella sonnei]|nr:aminotransferase [Shigella sonnei]